MPLLPGKGGLTQFKFILPLSFVVAIAVLAVSSHLITQRFIFKGVAALEAEAANKQAAQAVRLFTGEMDLIALRAESLATSDDIYKFAADQNVAFAESRFNTAMFTRSKMDLALVLNAKGEIIFSRRYNRATKTESYIPDPLQKAFAPDSKFFKTLLGGAPGPKGLIVLDDATMMMASFPVLKGDGTGPARGALVVGRFINEMETAEMAKEAGLTLKTVPFLFATSDMAQVVSDVLQPGGIAFSALNKDMAAGYILMMGVDGAPGIIIRASFSRAPFNQMRTSATFANTAFVVIAALLFGVGSYMLFKIRLIDRIDRITRILKGIGSGPDAPDRVIIKGSDEITDLSLAINTILGAGGADRAASLTTVSESGTEGGLDRSAALLKASLESSPAAVAVVDSNGFILACNRKYIDLWHLLPEHRAAPSREDRDEYFANQLDDSSVYLEKVVELSAYPETEGRLMAHMKDGKLVEMYSAPYRYKEKIIGRVWIYMDVTWRKEEVDSAKKEVERLQAEYESAQAKRAEAPKPSAGGGGGGKPAVAARGAPPAASAATVAALPGGDVEIEDYSHIFGEEMKTEGAGEPAAGAVADYSQDAIPEITIDGMSPSADGMTTEFTEDYSHHFTPEISIDGMSASVDGMTTEFTEDYSHQFTPEISIDGMSASASGMTTEFTEDYSPHFTPEAGIDGAGDLEISLDTDTSAAPLPPPSKDWGEIEGLEIEIDK